MEKYDWDAPGFLQGTTAGGVYRYRANFREYVTTPSGKRLSTYNEYYVRFSCTFDSTGKASFFSGIAGDNEVGGGSTNLSWDLK